MQQFNKNTLGGLSKPNANSLSPSNLFAKPSLEEVLRIASKPKQKSPYSDAEVMATAKEITQNMVRLKTTPASKKAAQTLLAIFEGVIVPLFNQVYVEMKEMELTDLEAVGMLPEGAWDNMNPRQRKLFIEGIYKTVEAANKSQAQVGRLIDEYQATLDMLTDETQNHLLDLQSKLLKVIFPPPRKPRAKKQPVAP